MSAALQLNVSVIEWNPPAQATRTFIVGEEECPRGFWCTAGLRVQCAVGFYNPSINENNETACIRCPDHATTLGKSSTSLSDCLCDTEYYNRADVGVDCVRCPIGTDCTAPYSPGVTLQTLPIKPGYFRMSASTNDTRVCRDAAVNCPAGEPECTQSHSGCAGGNDPATACQPLLEGPFCLVCKKNMSQPHYYADASDAEPATCKPCPFEGLAAFGLIAAAVAAVLLVLLVLLAAWRLWRLMPAKWRDRLTEPFMTYRIRTKLKCIIGFYLIVCKIGVVYQISLPPAVTALLSSFDVALSFGLDLSARLSALAMAARTAAVVLDLRRSRSR